MKARIKKGSVLQVIVIGFGALSLVQACAQTLTPLYSFTGAGDGGYPQCGLILSGTTLYGTTSAGGSLGKGTIFRLNTNGTGFGTVYTFNGATDGGVPEAGLILSGNTLYGTTTTGGSLTGGTVFKVNVDGTGFQVLHTFGGNNEAYPQSGLILSGNTLYGTVRDGGGGYGTVFSVNTDGTGFTTVHTFNDSDGAYPWAGLILLDNVLYGTTTEGGNSGSGTVFKVNTDGTGFVVLYHFTSLPSIPGRNSDGAFPYGGLVSAGNALYGTTFGGGADAYGTVFKLSTDAADFTVLHSFIGAIDGGGPYYGGSLTLSGGTLYGAARLMGVLGNGTVFKVNTDGTGFAVLHNFSGFQGEGGQPRPGLVLSGNALYGTTEFGGTSNEGTVFCLALGANSPQLTVAASGANLILTWPTNAVGFTLQSTTSLDSSIWSTNLPAPAVVNGQNTVTVPFSGIQQFFRLGQ